MPRDMTKHHGKQQRPTAYHNLFLDPLAKTYLPLIAQLIKNPPAMLETWVQSLGWEDPWRMDGYPLQYRQKPTQYFVK